METKKEILAINDYLSNYLDCNTEKWGNLKGDLSTLVYRYNHIEEIYNGKEVNLYNYAINLVSNDAENLIDKIYNYFMECYGENLYFKLLECMLENIYND